MPGRRQSALPVHDWFLLAKEADGCSQGTIDWLKGALSDLERFCAANGFPTDLAKLRQEHVLAWLVDLRKRTYRNNNGKKLKQNSTNNYWRAVRLFYNWCLETGKLKKTPIAGIKGPKPEQVLIPVFKPHHVQVMLRFCPPNTWWGARDKAIVLTLLLTGTRLAEMANLKLSSISFNEHYIRVKGKGNKERKIHMERGPNRLADDAA